MPGLENEPEITLSVVERLIDRELDAATDSHARYSQSIRQLKASLKRDLEWLLNTRRIADDLPESFRELRRSVYVYGLPDVNSMSIHSSRDQVRLLRIMETTIASFEPRLRNVRITLDPLSANTRSLRFQIMGLLRIEPAPEQVVFDTVLQLSSGEYEVK